ncbi:MAG: tetratricopeptide repeat protein [Chloroherpetonaceae bacterium]|nr:tetratricopeptide repeat protein [Chloroherpetonaceae bacterium]MDW8437214.1 tetratricopeptide repeat protein [Chloroherpetonaceae bacterium]
MKFRSQVLALPFWLAVASLGACGGAKEIATEELEAARRDSLAIVSGKAFFVKGIDAYNDKDYAQALAHFKSAEPFILAGTKYNANDKALLYNAIGKSFFFLGNADSAAYYFAAAQIIEPQNYEAYNNSGYVKFVQREYDLAISDFKKALSIKPDYAEAIENLKLAEEFKSGKLVWDAEALFDKAEQARDVDEKIHLYSRLVQLAPQFADAKNNLGVALFRAGRLDDALNVFSQLVAEHKDYAIGFNNLGYVYEALGKRENAIANYRKALELNPRFVLALENLSSVLYEQADYEGSLKAAQEVLLYEPNNQDAKARIARCEKELKGKRKKK